MKENLAKGEEESKQIFYRFTPVRPSVTNLNINTPCSSSSLTTPSLNNFENSDILNTNEINISNVSSPPPPVSYVINEISTNYCTN